jgi:hypothetical protein
VPPVERKPCSGRVRGSSEPASLVATARLISADRETKLVDPAAECLGPVMGTNRALSLRLAKRDLGRGPLRAPRRRRLPLRGRRTLNDRVLGDELRDRCPQYRGLARRRGRFEQQTEDPMQHRSIGRLEADGEDLVQRSR